MANRIFDKTVLEETANFELSLDISSMYPIKNPDGTNPVMRLKVYGGAKLKVALAALKQFGASEGEAIILSLFEIMGPQLGYESPVDVEKLVEDERLTELFERTEQGFMDLFIDTNLVFEDGSEEEVKFTITAPSYAVAYEGMLELTSPRRLNSLVASFMPEDNDDYRSGW